MSGGAGDSPPPPAPPPSPEFPPVLLSACMDSIIHLALTDSSPDLTLSAAYRSALLQPDPLTTYQSLPPSHFPSGIPPHPLYKPLARSIHACMASGDFPGRPELTVGLPSWIAGTGIELSNMLEAVEFQLHVQDPFFSQLTAGKKTVEGRCATGNYNRMSNGTTHSLRCWRWRLSKMCFLELKQLKKRLSYDGIGHLLGMKRTVGTVPDALPPARSSLISSSLMLHRPNV